MLAIPALLIIGLVAFAWWRRGKKRDLARQRQRMYQAEQKLRQANMAVDQTFRDARVAMEESAGKREPGEQRFGDGLTGTWRNW